MRTFAILLIPALASAFSPSSQVASTLNRGGGISLNGVKEDVLDKYADELSSTTESVVEKVDDLVLRKALTAANHVPVLFTLKNLGEAAGSSNFGVDAAASAFSAGPATAVAIPAFISNLMPLACAIQLASMAKSALAGDNEVSQADITATAVTNYALMKAITTGDMAWLLASAVASSYPNRSGANFKAGIHTLSLQIMSSVTTLTAVLAVVTKACSYVPFLDGKDEFVGLLGLLGFYSHSKRQGNTTVKKSINAAAALGMLWSKVSSGALNISSVSSVLSLKTVGLLGTAALAYNAAKSAKEAI